MTKDRILYQSVAPLALLLMAVAAPVALLLLKAGTPGPVPAAVLLFVVVALLDVVAAWAFYHLLEETHRPLAQLALILRVAYAVLLVAALSPYAPGSGPEAYRQFDYQWNLALLIFGVHLLVLGGLLWKSGLFHFILGLLVMVSGAGYLFDAVVKILVPNPFSISVYTFFGEVLLIFWLPLNVWRLRKKAS